MVNFNTRKRRANGSVSRYVVGDHIEVLTPLNDVVCGYVLRRADDISDGLPGFELARTPGGQAHRWGYDCDVLGVTDGGDHSHR